MIRPLTHSGVSRHATGVRVRSIRGRGLSLRGWLILLVAVVALPLSTLAGIAVWRAHDTGRARAEEELLNRARVMALVVDREFERVAIGLRTLAASTVFPQEDFASFEREARDVATMLDGTPICLVTPDGRQIFSTLWEEGERRPEATAPPFARESFALGTMVITNLVRSQGLGRLITAVTVPVFGSRDAGGLESPDLVLAAALPQGRLAALLQESGGGGGTGPGWVAAVMDRDGRIVARTLNEDRFIGHRVTPAFATRVARKAEGVMENSVTYEGEPASFAYARASRSGYTVILGMPEAAFYAPLREMLGQVALAAVLLLLAGAGFAAMLAGRIRQELRRLGDARPAPSSGLREVDDLAHALAIAAEERDRAVAHLAASEHRFRALAEAGALVIWRGDGSGAILEGQGWQDLTGQPETALQGDGWLEKVHPEDRAETVATWALVRAARRPVDFEFRVLTRAGAWRLVRARGVPVAGAAGEAPAEWVGVLEDVEDRRLAERAMVEREARLRLAMEAAQLSAWEFDIASGRGVRRERPGDTTLAPPAVGFGLEEWLGKIHPEDRPRVRLALQDVTEGRTSRFAAEFRVRRRPPAEGWAWIASHGAVTERDPVADVPRRLAGVAQDVSERREAEQRRILLAREVDHRAKNVLAVVRSVLRLTRRDRPEEFAAAVESRIDALARAHTLLAEEGWAGADMRALAERELASFSPDRICLEGPGVALTAPAVQPVAMVLHELATNAAKYGSLSQPGGEVVLRWAVGPGQLLHLTWSERGGPPVLHPPARRGFGSRLMGTTVRHQLGGTLDLDWDAAGLTVAIALPAERALAEPGLPLGPVPETQAVAA
jgi:PAS domain S-box-containing protein